MDRFQDKYTIKSARLNNYDYSQNGMYFVTICTKNRECYFGNVIGEKIKLSEIGEIIKEELLKTPIIRKDVFLDEWVIMPNHVHGIIEIKNEYLKNVETPRWGVLRIKEASLNNKTPQRGVSTEKNNNNWKSNCLGSIVNQFKSACTKRIWKSNFITFAWQPRFYDHIIRKENELNRIREYIWKNPQNWEKDKNNLENLFM